MSLVDTAISEDYLRTVLDGMEMAGNGTSFFYFEGAPLVSSHADDAEMALALISTGILSENELTGKVVSLNNVDYLVQTIYSPSLEGTLVSYVLIDEFISPLQRIKVLVYGSLFFLFLMGLAFSLFLYRHFRLPFGYLVKKIESLAIVSLHQLPVSYEATGFFPPAELPPNSCA